jgi:Lrp/AsnC family transcriptional regulator, leucine-responsive regulatory protein
MRHGTALKLEVTLHSIRCAGNPTYSGPCCGYKAPQNATVGGYMTSKAAPDGQLDVFDRKIIDVLREDGRIPVTELAERVGLSKTPCQNRLRRLIDQGTIRGFRAVLDPARLGLDHIAFTEVKLSDTREAALEEFNRAVLGIREVEECHMIASSFDYLLKVRTADIRRYREVLGERISSLPHVASTSTFVAMETIRDAGG